MTIDLHTATGNARQYPESGDLPPPSEGWERITGPDAVAQYEARRDAILATLPPPPPVYPEPVDYPITKDTIVYRMKMGGKLGVLMAFIQSLPPELKFEFDQSAWFERSTWAQYVALLGLSDEETAALLSPED